MADDRKLQEERAYRIANEPQQNFPLSRRGYEKLKRELVLLEERWKEEWAELDSVTDPDDPSEELAAEWEARKTKEQVEERIRHLRLVIDHAVVLDEDPDPDTANIGDRIMAINMRTGQEMVFDLVSSDEVIYSADTDYSDNTNEISINSPVGELLNGAQVGDVVEAQTPDGSRQYQIVKIGRISA